MIKYMGLVVSRCQLFSLFFGIYSWVGLIMLVCETNSRAYKISTSRRPASSFVVVFMVINHWVYKVPIAKCMYLQIEHLL